jgi:hypothetical protein
LTQHGIAITNGGSRDCFHAISTVMPIDSGGKELKVRIMIETTVDYWTCMDLAQALEQTMRNDLWSTADRIAETASRITKKPDELVAALKKYEIHQAATSAATEILDAPIATFPKSTDNFSKAS